MLKSTNLKSSNKWFKTLILASVATVIVFTAALITYAYFATRVYVYTDDGSKHTFQMGMELNTFFDEINSTNTTKVADGTNLGIVCTDTEHTASSDIVTVDGVSYYVYKSSAEWGSANNPYIISKKAHLLNLYVLQNCGYLEQRIAGVTEADIPYFLVCNPDGSAVSIDCTDTVSEPIGNEKYPFVGYVGGAFKDSTITIAGKSSTQSVIYNATVQTEEDVIDVGLFGHIGYVKDGAISSENTFTGTVSTVRDLLLYDVTVKVAAPSILDKIADALATHLFAYRKYDSNGDAVDVADVQIPHENHHIGILAGHVELGTVEYISVYYSSDDVPAIDVQYVNPSLTGNFKSVSGILGFCYEMNSAQSDGTVTIGGINNDDIQISNGGEGTGGGLESGTGRGYVTAAEVYEAYKDNGKIVKVLSDDGKGTVLKYGLLVNFYYDGTNTSLTLSDGRTTVSIASDYQSIITTTTYSNFFGGTATYSETWQNFIIHDVSTTNKSQEYLYYDHSGNVAYATQSQIEKTGVSLKYAAKAEKDSDGNIESFTYLCTQYERSRIVTGTQITNRFYFYDGVFTFALSDATDTIESTWQDDKADTITVGLDSDSQWTQDLSGLPNSVVAFIKPIKSVDELQSGKQIFIAYKDGDSYNIVTLEGNSTYTSGGGDNAVTTPKTTLSLADSTLTSMISTSLKNGTLSFVPENATTTLETLNDEWGDIQILNLGTASSSVMTLDELRNHYQVKVSFQAQNPSQGYYEDDGTTAIPESAVAVLEANAKADSTSQYYAITSVSEIMSDSSYGSSFTFFTLVGSATVNINNAKTAVDNNNSTYYDLNDNIVSASDIQSAINTRNNKYLARGTSNGKDNTEIPNNANVKSAISTINGRYFWVNGVSISSSAPYMTLTDSSKTAALSDIITGTYYYNSNESAAIGSSYTSTLNSLSSSASAYTDTRQYTFTEFYYFNTRRTSVRIYYEFYKVSGNSISSVLKNNYTSLFATEADDRVNSLLGARTSQNGITYCTYNNVTLPVLYEYDRDYYTAWSRNYGNDYVYDGSGTKVISSGSTLQFTANYTQSFNIIYQNILGSGDNYTLNGVTSSHICTSVARQGSAKVSTTAKWNDKTIFGTDHDLYSCTFNGTSYTNCILIVRYVLDGTFVRTLTGNGLQYSFYNGSSFTSAGTVSEASGRTYKVNGTARQLYRDGTHLGFCIYNFKLDGILLESLTGTGLSYSVVAPDGSVLNWNGEYTEWNIGQTVSADGITYRIYRGTDGRLGVRAANQTIDGILLQTLTANGCVCSVVNGSTNAQLSTMSNSATFSNTGETISVNNKTYTIWRSSDNKLGIRLVKEKIDGIIVQTLTGTGVVYSLVNSSSKTSLGSASRTFTKVSGTNVNVGDVTHSIRTVTVDGVAHQVYKSGNYYCIRLANIQTDGYFVSYVYPGQATNYKHYDQQGNETVHSAPMQIPGVTISLSNGTTTKNYNLYVRDNHLSIQLIHIQTDQTFNYQFWHDGNAASSAQPYYLRILRRAYSVGSSKFSIICATDARVANTEDNRDDFGTTFVPCRSLTNSKDCSVILNGDGTAYLQYTVNGETRYLSYSTSGGYFTTASDQNSTTRLYLFTVEGTHDATAGERVVPLAGTTVATYEADKYVLWPDNVYYSDDSTTTAYKASTVNTNYSYSTDTTYHIVSLASLQTLKWNNKSGNAITYSDMYKVFSLGDGISQINMVNLWNGNTGTILGQDEYVKAPIGTTGEETFIPTGCVAFKVTTSGEHYVRVIVAVPVTEFYYGMQIAGAYQNPTAISGDGLDYSKDYNFCMWKITETTSGSFQFSPDNCYASFELPRSTPFKEKEDFTGYYSNISGNGNSAYGEYVKKYINITMNGNTYRAYLNGDEVLVAYQFKASDVGVYLLGSTQDCRIVYFSADSTASSGKDGVNNYRMGTIDFVYDNGYDSTAATKILTTRDGDTTIDGVYDYQNYYYPSLCIAFTDNANTAVEVLTGDTDTGGNGYANINDFAFCVRRKRTQSASGIDWYAIGGTQVSGGITDAAYIRFSNYSLDSDSITRGADRLR